MSEERKPNKTSKRHPQKSDEKNFQKAERRKYDNRSKNRDDDRFQDPHLRKRKPNTKKDEQTYSQRPSKSQTGRPFGYKGKRAVADKPIDNTIRLNKYLANAGISTRREADELIKSGLVEVNGKPVTEMGYRVQPGDVVKYAGERVKPEKLVYYLLNKPRDYTAEMRFTNDRRNALTLLQGIGNYHVQPIGKMDRATSGLMVYTNDGEMIMKLASTKFKIKKIFHVHLNKNIKPDDLQQLTNGIELKDGIVRADEASYVGDKKDKRQIGIEIKSGKNKVVRRMLEALGYQVVKLDRVMYGELTKKDLPRGRWRELTPQEVINLKMLK